MTNPPRRWTRIVSASAVAFALSAPGSTTSAAPADLAQGEKLAKRWCAACHVVSADQTQGADNVPAFA
jgi:mono/diheme cytochrome c family protein